MNLTLLSWGKPVKERASSVTGHVQLEAAEKNIREKNSQCLLLREIVDALPWLFVPEWRVCSLPYVSQGYMHTNTEEVLAESRNTKRHNMLFCYIEENIVPSVFGHC